MSRRHTLRLAKQRAAAKREEEPSGRRWPYFEPYAWVTMVIQPPAFDINRFPLRKPNEINWISKY